MTVIKNGISITSNAETIRNIDGLYQTRYRAEKDKRNNPYIPSDSVIVKVCGGYAIMTAEDYRTWKNQK